MLFFDELYLPYVSTSVDLSAESYASYFTTFQEVLDTNNRQCEYTSPSVDYAEGALHQL